MSRAGQPAEASDLIDIDELIAAYYDRKPDPAIASQRVAFGTSGHRGSSLSSSFNEDHILATTQAIVDYRASQGITGPLFLGRDTHGLSLPAERTAIENALLRNDHRINKAAAELGISRVTLYRMMIEHGLNDHDNGGENGKDGSPAGDADNQRVG